MNVSKNFVGVDVSKKTLDVYIHPIKKSYQVTNNHDGINDLIKILSTFKSIEKIACEATGGFEELLINLLRMRGFCIWRVNPRQMKSFINSEGVRAKTDAIDAKYIALFASQKQQIYNELIPSQDEKVLQDLTKRRSNIVEMIKQEKTRFKNPNITDFGKKSIIKHLKFLDTEKVEINNAIQALLSESKELEQKAKIITSMSGIGNTTAAVLLSELPELGRIESKPLAALAGLAPYQNQSGIYKGMSRTAGGRNKVRHALYLASLAASRHNPILKDFYTKLIAVGKKPKSALIAVARKIVCTLNTLLIKNELWNPTFHQESRVKSAVPAVEALC
jgi:transposase